MLDIVGMGMADGDDGMTAVEVQIFGPLVIPDMTAAAFDDVYVEKRIYVE